jgi:hypothetical protein
MTIPLFDGPGPEAPPASARAREELEWVLSKYDHGALPSGIAALVKKIQTDIAWREHGQMREAI